MMSCADNGVIGMCPGVIGVLAALECVKLVLGLPGTLKGRLLRMDGLEGTYKTGRLRGRQQNCAVCSKHGRQKFVVEKFDYEGFAGSGEEGLACGVGLKLNGWDLDLGHVKISEWGEVLGWKEECFFLDVRPKTQYEIIHFKPRDRKVVHIAWEELKTFGQGECRERLGGKGKIFCFCRKGVDSLVATAYLNFLGIGECENVSGGL